MTKLLITTISGFSASSRKEKKTLEGFIQDVLKDGNIDAEVRSFFSIDDDCVQRLVLSANSTHAPKVLIVGKSLGGVRAWWALTKYWAHFKLKLAHWDTKLGVVLLDPHGCQVGDGKVGAYGKRLKKLGYLPAWLRDDVKIKVMYQRNKYPEGVGMLKKDNVENVRLSKRADHFNITQIDTIAGAKCAKAIQDMIGWLDE